MQHLFKVGVVFMLLVMLSGCFFEFSNQFSSVAPGPWRGVLELDPKFITPNPKGEPLPEKLNLEFEEVSQGELPFNFEIVYDNDTSFHIILKNAEERIKLDQISFGRDIRTGSDTMMIEFPVFDSYISASYEENVIAGKWVVNYREENGVPYEIPFVARYGQDHRFTTLEKAPIFDISGRWEARFEIDTETPYPAVGEFQQEGNHVTGTFLTETGDYRFLEGTIQGNKLYLSCFDGSHAFLFEAKINPDSTMIGSFKSGKHYRTVWEAKKNEASTLADPNQLTYLKEGYEDFDFSFTSTEGQMVALSDEQFSDKVKIIQLFSSSCPNCRDQTNFLLDFIKETNSDDLVVIGLGFERYDEQDKSMDALQRYKAKMNIPYTVLLAGKYDKEEAQRALPMLNHVLAYPTLIFVDRNNNIRKIHTGFSGPATSKYEDFRKEFKSTVQDLLLN